MGNTREHSAERGQPRPVRVEGFAQRAHHADEWIDKRALVGRDNLARIEFGVVKPAYREQRGRRWQVIRQIGRASCRERVLRLV